MRVDEARVLLGVDDDAQPDEVRRAYLRMVRIYHPDRWLDAAEDIREEASRRTRDVTSAYELLKARVGATTTQSSSSTSKVGTQPPPPRPPPPPQPPPPPWGVPTAGPASPWPPRQTETNGQRPPSDLGERRAVALLVLVGSAIVGALSVLLPWAVIESVIGRDETVSGMKLDFTGQPSDSGETWWMTWAESHIGALVLLSAGLTRARDGHAAILGGGAMVVVAGWAAGRISDASAAYGSATIGADAGAGLWIAVVAGAVGVVAGCCLWVLSAPSTQMS